MDNNKIDGLRILDLKKKSKQRINNKISYHNVIENFNFKLVKNNILGIISNNEELNKCLFDLIVNNKIKNSKYQGFIEFKQSIKKEYFLTFNNLEYQKQLSYGFDDPNLFETETQDTVFSYLQKYIKKSNIINFLANLFKKNWHDIYQDSKYHLSNKYYEINLKLQKEITPYVEKLNDFLIKDDLNDLGVNYATKTYDKILLMQNIYNLIISIVKIIQKNEHEFLIYLEKRIKDYESGISLLKFKEYKEAKQEYTKLIYKRDFSKSNTKTNHLIKKIEKLIQNSKLRNIKVQEIKKYFSNLKNEFLQEKKYYKFHLNKKFKNMPFSYTYPRYYVNKVFYNTYKKYFSELKNINQSGFIEFVNDVFLLRDEIIHEISTIGILSIKKEFKQQVKFITKSILNKNTRMYADRFESLSNNAESLNILDNELDTKKQEKTNLYMPVSLAKLKEYEYDLEEKRSEYYWNIETEGKLFKENIKNLYNESLIYFKKNKSNLLFIEQKINFLLKKIYELNKYEFRNKYKNLWVLKPFFKAYDDLKNVKYLLFDLFNKFDKYSAIINNLKNNKNEIFNLILKSNIYKILDKSNISLDKLILNLSYLTLDEKISLEINKILINNPSVISIGICINKLNKDNQLSILNSINSYLLENKGIGIYFLNDINVASRITTDLNIIYNSRTIEAGKTSKIIDNPINPLIKKMLNLSEDNIEENINDFYKENNNYEIILKYEVETDHFIYCKWSQLSKWATIDNIKTKKIRNILFLDSQNTNTKSIKETKIHHDEKNIIEYIGDNIAAKKGGNQMDKNFDFNLVEKNRNQKWIDMKAFSNHNLNKKPFTIILPPPNITGKLHIGHALDTYIADTIIRYKKNKGFDVMWVAGKDHAGIATQAVVERKLAISGINKYELGREQFINKIWEWKEDLSNNITKQWAKLGLALDYTSERFTLDKEANEAVLKVFISMYKDNLIYRDTKAINWDPKLKTALSNIEVIPTEIKQKMYYVKYSIKNSSNYLVIATTRLETMFSDVAIAYNPNDERYKDLKNHIIIHPLTKKEIPVISSNLIDIDFGSGLMKVSAHAIDDIEIIKNNNLDIIECINDDGKMNANAQSYEGLDRFAARELISKYLEKNNLLEKVEEVISNVGLSERSKEPIEILVKPQWFVRMKRLAERLLKNLNSSNKVEIIPHRFEANLVRWMENIHDWIISRQIWWGHRIPAWYKDNEVLVQINSPGEDWIQDSDVLDTWFSSALAPFVFLGWPKNTEKLKRYFPTSLLVTGYDIIFFWVSRMYFQSLEFMGDIPFKKVLLHGLVRDAQGKKMSKSLGNGVDPIEMIEKYGSDILRMTLIFNSTPGMDINFSDDKIQNTRLFINKFWNISRLIKTYKVTNNETLDYSKLDLFDKWILLEFNKMNQNIDEAMVNYEFTIVYKHIYDFIINKFSSWYLEFLKFKNNNYFIHYLFKEILITLHPYMPFLTDYLFETIYHEELLETKINDYVIEKEFDNNNINNLIELITILRKYREDKQISKSKTLSYFTQNYNLSELEKLIIFKLSNFIFEENDDYMVQTLFAKLFIKQSQTDKEEEILELKNLINKTISEIEFNEKFLNNHAFMQKAPQKQIDEKKQKLEIHKKKLLLYQEELKNKEEKILD